VQLFSGTPYDYASVAPEGALVFTAGACPLDEDGRVVAIGDHEGQAEQALRNLRAALAEVGSSFEQVLKTTVYVVAADLSKLVGT
jgi:enamine deaminase RidA (YjgF/YER057c/UK114 family)